MAKLCYKSDGTIKKYDLKDSADTPRLAVKINGSTKYLPLKVGAANSKEISIKNSGSVYHIQTWAADDPSNWNITPYRGTTGHKGDTDFGGCAIWALTYEGKLAFILGMLSADKPELSNSAVWEANRDPNIELTDYDCGTPCIRLATHPFGIDSSARYYHAVPETIYTYLTSTSMLGSESVSLYYTSKYLGWGASYLDTKYSSLPSSAKDKTSAVAGNMTQVNRQHYYRIDVYNDSHITMLGESDDGMKYIGKWATRCFLVEYPEVINTGLTPRQVLNIWKSIMENNNVYTTDFGTCYGRNYSSSELRPVS